MCFYNAIPTDKREAWPAAFALSVCFVDRFAQWVLLLAFTLNGDEPLITFSAFILGVVLFAVYVLGGTLNTLALVEGVAWEAVCAVSVGGVEASAERVGLFAFSILHEEPSKALSTLRVRGEGLAVGILCISQDTCALTNNIPRITSRTFPIFSIVLHTERTHRGAFATCMYIVTICTQSTSVFGVKVLAVRIPKEHFTCPTICVQIVSWVTACTGSCMRVGGLAQRVDSLTDLLIGVEVEPFVAGRTDRTAERFTIWVSNNCDNTSTFLDCVPLVALCTLTLIVVVSA